MDLKCHRPGEQLDLHQEEASRLLVKMWQVYTLPDKNPVLDAYNFRSTPSWDILITDSEK